MSVDRQTFWIIVVCLGLFLILVLALVCRKSTDEGFRTDRYIDKMMSRYFGGTPPELAVVTCYHHADYVDYAKSLAAENPKPFILVADGEPNSVKELDMVDLVVTTKLDPTLLPQHCPAIYLPYYVWRFIEDDTNPTLLVKPTGYPSRELLAQKTKFCAFMYSNCDETYEGVRLRKEFLRVLQKRSGNRVDVLGKCYRESYPSKQTPELKRNNPAEIYLPYKFVISFENQPIKGYISEKIVFPMAAGAIPIYLGAPDVGNHFDLSSLIHVRDFSSFDAVADHVLALDQNDGAYQQILQRPWLKGNVIDKSRFDAYYGGAFYQKLAVCLPEKFALKIAIRDYVPFGVWFTTFADGKVCTSERIVNEAKKSGYFNRVIPYNAYDLLTCPDLEFIKTNKRGYGYWIWKPWLILQTLFKMEDGDILVYCDAGNSIMANTLIQHKKMAEYYVRLCDEKCEGNSAIFFENHTFERCYTKMDAILAILPNPTEEFLDGHQLAGGVFLLRKTPATIGLISQWYEYCKSESYHLLDDSPSVAPNHPDFIEHRHDQSILSLVAKSRNVTILPDNYRDYFCDANPFAMMRKR